MDISLERIGKRYGETAVLRDVSLSLAGGQVHGLIGENGAGKSTVAKVLCGAVRPDSGRLLVDGRPARVRSPRDALGHGIALVAQEGAIVPALTVLENVLLGTPSARAGLGARAGDRRRFAGLLGRTGLALDPDARAGSLPLADRQRVELLRALAHEARLVVLDEPTATLPRADAGRLLALVRRLAAQAGIGFVLISHRLAEVLDVCDTVTVLRDGRRVRTMPAAEATVPGLLRDMAGMPVATLYPQPAPVPDSAPVVLDVHRLRRAPTVRGVSLSVREGEIVGLAGLTGSGRTETLRLVFGADRRDDGEVVMAGRRVAGPAAAMAAGAALIPASRAEQGLVLARSTAENLALASLAQRRRLGFVRRGAERRAVRRTADRLDIRGAGLGSPAWTLSGGNQQKSLFGKWLIRRPRLLLADEPTRGVDMAARSQLHRLIVEQAAQGVGVLLASSDIDEVLGLAHRVLVLRDGRVAGEFPRGSADARDVLALAGLADPR